MKVLLSAYACQPNAGTEPGHGWGLATALARRGIQVHVLTVVEHSELIEAYLDVTPTPNVKFTFVGVPTGLFKECSGMHYALWQCMIVFAARKLMRTETFDLVHHITYGSIHVPTQLWRLGLPTIFGPVGGGQTAPVSMLGFFGKDRRKEERRTLLTRIIRHSPFHRRWLARMDKVMVANQDTLNLARDLGCDRPEWMFEVMIPDEFPAAAPRVFQATDEPIKVLWVGRMLPRKGLQLTLDAFQRVQCPSTLTIVGNGMDESELRSMIAERGLTDRVFWNNCRVPWSEVREAYACHDVMLFTSLRETGGAQIAEAMALGLPVITLNLHGPGEIVPDGAGFKVNAVDPAQVVPDVAAAVDTFAGLSAQERTRMSKVAWLFARRLTYGRRAEVIEELYGQVCHQRRRPVSRDTEEVLAGSRPA